MKASRSGVRVLTILAFIEGAITVVKDKHADPLVMGTVSHTKNMCMEAMNNWPIMGDNEAVTAKCYLKIQEIKEGLDKIWWLKVKPEMNYPGMCYLAIQLLDDLMRFIKDNKKLLLLQDIYDGLETLTDHVDPDGKMYLTQDRAQEIVSVIYGVVGEN